MKKGVFVLLMVVVVLSLQAQDMDGLESATFKGLAFRSIGPAVFSGRITDFAVNTDNPVEYYVAVASGGVWKTLNSGTTWKPVFDEQASYSIGCLAMDPDNHHVIWVGTGENNSQRSVSYGDGVYKSIDGGASWQNMGLKKSEHIGKILIDPGNSDVVYVASQGPLWGAGGDRGLFKTTDGGKTWENILFISEHTGVTDLVMDPRHPDVLYAAAYQRRRHVFTLINGGPESAIYKSRDGGRSWNKLSSGLPSVDLGRIGLAISPANPDVLYSIVEAAEGKGGFFRSTNRGASWEKRNDYIARSPQYYMEIVADPVNVDRVYSLDTFSKITDDGGKTWKTLGREYRHVDDHALWIDPDFTDHLLIGGDGGIYETFDGGKNWDFKENLPITQFYRVAVDNELPFYNVFGGTQDNASMGGPSRTKSRNGIVNADWFVTKGGDGFETQIDPTNPDIIYAQSQYGWLVRYDKKSGEAMGIKPQIDMGEKPLRWNWDSPLLISPHSPTRLYFGANRLYRSDDRGNSWKAISEDLTRQIDRNSLEVMGRIWGVDAVSKNASTSLYGNIVALTESPLKAGLLYIGTDDGLVQVSEDGGDSWRKIETFPGVPEKTYVSFLYASQHEPNTVYAAFDNHKNADFHPYILKSADAGKTWSAIHSDLPQNGPVYAVVEDHVVRELLFAGTEFGVFFSRDGGEQWIQLKGGLPTISVRDIAIQKRENDLVLATFGRSFYILDDFSPLRQVTPKLLEKPAHLFPVKDALMYIQTYSGTGSQGAPFYQAENPPFGATFTYYLKESIQTRKQRRQERENKLRRQGKPIPYPSFEALRAEDAEKEPYLIFAVGDDNGETVRRITAPAKKGIHRVSWDLRYPGTSPVELKEKNASGVLAMPGTYEVSLYRYADGKTTRLAGPVEFEAKVLGQTTLPAKERRQVVAFQNKVSDLRRAVQGAQKTVDEFFNKIAHIRKAIHLTPELPLRYLDEIDTLEAEARDISIALSGDPTIRKRNANQPPSISDRLNTIVYEQWRSTSAPTQTQRRAFGIAAEKFEPNLKALQELVKTKLVELENRLKGAGAPWTPGRVPEWRLEPK